MIKIHSICFDSAKGAVYVEGPITGQYLNYLDFSHSLNNFRRAAKQKNALVNIANSPDGMLYIARNLNTVIGYITFHNPDHHTRWAQHPKILELGAVEVCPSWRNCKIAKNLLVTTFKNPVLEDYIVVTMEYSWHWDLDRSGLSIWNYQKMLTGLFYIVGMKKCSTNDPEIMENPANVLMARIGKNISFEMIELFNKLRFSETK